MPKKIKEKPKHSFWTQNQKKEEEGNSAEILVGEYPRAYFKRISVLRCYYLI